MLKKPLHLPPKKKWKGLTIYCYKCLTNVTECRETGKPLNSCPFGDRHAYKVYVNEKNGGNKRRTKILDTRDPDEAVKMAIDFYREVKEHTVDHSNVPKATFQSRNSGREVPILLMNAVARFSGWLHNEDVPYHRQIERSPQYLVDIERKLKLFVSSLKKNGRGSISMDQLEDNDVGNFIRFLKEEKKYSPETVYKHLSYCSSLIKWFSNQYYPVKNYFDGLTKKPISGKNPPSISRDVHFAILNKTTKENGEMEYKGNVKRLRNFYRYYLKDAYMLGLETGFRMENLTDLRFSNITEDRNGGGFVRVENFKINKIEKRTTEERKKYIYVALTPSLKKLLVKLGYGTLPSESHVLAPEIIKNRKTIGNAISRGFSHYYKQLGEEKVLTFKSYRKAFLTKLSLLKGNETYKISGHTNEKTLDRHYKDEEVVQIHISRTWQGFTEEWQRERELEQSRNKSVKQNNKEVER